MFNDMRGVREIYYLSEKAAKKHAEGYSFDVSIVVEFMVLQPLLDCLALLCLSDIFQSVHATLAKFE